MGHSGGGMGLGVQCGVRAERRGELHDRSGESEKDRRERGGARAQCVHGEGGGENGAVH